MSERISAKELLNNIAGGLHYETRVEHAIQSVLTNLGDEIEHLTALLDPPVCRLQLPNGDVPGNAAEAAVGWKTWADEYRNRAESFERMYKNVCRDQLKILAELQETKAAAEKMVARGAEMDAALDELLSRVRPADPLTQRETSP